MRAKYVIDYSLGPELNLDALRQVVEETQNIDGKARFEIKTEAGQRDAVYYHLIITQERPFG